MINKQRNDLIFLPICHILILDSVDFEVWEKGIYSWDFRLELYVKCLMGPYTVATNTIHGVFLLPAFRLWNS